MSKRTTTKTRGGHPATAPAAKRSPRATKPKRPSKPPVTPNSGGPSSPSAKRKAAAGNYRLEIATLSGDAITLTVAGYTGGLLLELSQQEKLLRFLLGRQDLFAVPTLPPFVVRVSLPYETDEQQTTPAKNYTYAFDTMPKAEIARDNLSYVLRHFNDSRVVCEILSLPEKDFYVEDLKCYEGPPDEIPYAFLNEVLGEPEHRALGKACFAKLTRDEWRSMLLLSLDYDAVEAAIDEFSKFQAGDVFKDALVASRTR